MASFLRGPHLWLACSLAVGSWLLGCSPGHPGRLMLVITSDLPLDAIAGVRVEVAGETREIGVRPGAATLPLSLVIEARPDRPAGQPVEILTTVVGTDGSNLVTRPTTTTFLPNRTLVLRVDLARRCTPLSGCTEQLRCGPGEACTANGCVTPTIDSATLPDLRVPGEEIGASSTYTPLEACQAISELNCGAAVRCCPAGAGIDPAELERIRGECVVASMEACVADVIPLLEDPRTGYDAVRAAAAIQEGMRLAASCDLSFADWDASSERGLFSALRGSLAPGQACPLMDTADVFACRDGTCNAFASGTCASRACRGEPCTGDTALADYGCGDGLHCAPGVGGAPATCQRRLPTGEECDRDTQCESLICSAVGGSSTKTCRARTASTVFCFQDRMM